jgi:hypothetical protein
MQLHLSKKCELQVAISLLKGVPEGRQQRLLTISFQEFATRHQLAHLIK